MHTNTGSSSLNPSSGIAYSGCICKILACGESSSSSSGSDHQHTLATIPIPIPIPPLPLTHYSTLLLVTTRRFPFRFLFLFRFLVRFLVHRTGHRNPPQHRTLTEQHPPQRHGAQNSYTPSEYASAPNHILSTGRLCMSEPSDWLGYMSILSYLILSYRIADSDNSSISYLI